MQGTHMTGATTAHGDAPMITVVVPVYNMGGPLEKCMDSLLAQTYQDYEIIIVDDGSRQEDAEACDVQAARSPRARAIHKPNGGLPSARNRGIEEAGGAFITFPDPDDWVEPDYLEVLIDTYMRNRADVSSCSCYFCENGRESAALTLGEEKVYGRDEALRLLLQPYRSLLNSAWSKLYSMEIIRSCELRYDEELLASQDMYFNFRYFMHCERIAYTPRPLYHYNLHSGGVSLISTPLTARKLTSLKSYEKAAALVRDYGDAELLRAVNRAVFDHNLSFIYAYYYNHTNEPELLKTFKHQLRAHKADYFPNDYYSRRHQLLARVALISPRLYYILLRLKRRLSGQES